MEDDRDLAWTYEQLISSLPGFTSVVVHSFSALKNQRDAVLSCGVALLDINLGEGEPSGIDAYQWLLGEKFQGNVIFITGHACSHPVVVRAVAVGAVKLMPKPFNVEVLLNTIAGKKVPNVHR